MVKNITWKSNSFHTYKKQPEAIIEGITTQKIYRKIKNPPDKLNGHFSKD